MDSRLPKQAGSTLRTGWLSACFVYGGNRLGMAKGRPSCKKRAPTEVDALCKCK